MHKRIVTIDGFADIKHTVFNQKNIVNFEYVGETWNKSDNTEFSNPHGTAVCGIISRETKDIDIVNFNVYCPSSKERLKRTINALSYVDKNIECDLINMSLGVRIDNDILREYCLKLYNKGVIIVAAFDNAGAVSFPAAYPFVIGVDVSPKCRKVDEFVWVENSIVNIRGNGNTQRVPWIDNSYTFNQGASFAAPHISSFIMNQLSAGVKKNNIQTSLKEKSVYQYYFEINQEELMHNVEKIKRAAIFPYNKEMHALIRNSSLLNFEIAHIYNSKYVGKIGEKLQGENKTYTIENIEKCNWNDFDTFIIGHLIELETQIQKDIKSKILEMCLLHNINVYLYDSWGVEDYVDKFKNKNLFIDIQGKRNFSVSSKFGKLFCIGAPVVGFFGTGKKQGKYTLQLALRKKFLKAGYKVGQLGTEPNSPLFGMDETYPFGYAGIIDTEPWQMIENINYLMHKIDIRHPDIILAGSQSGTAPRAFYNTGQMTVLQLNFLSGVNPDAIVLSVNADDNIHYIERTIKTIEGVGRGKVIGIVIYPFMYKNGWGIIRDKKDRISSEEEIMIVNRIKEHTNIDTFVLGNEETEEQVYNLCINFFRRKNE